jgi:hypothetical protein
VAVCMMTMHADVVGSDMEWANGEVTCGPMRRFHVAPSGSPNLVVPSNMAEILQIWKNLTKSS